VDGEVSGHRLGSGVFFFGTAIVVVLVGLLAALVTWALHPAAKRPCISHCPPPVLQSHAAAASGLAEGQTFAGTTGFHVEYPRDWQVPNKGSNGVAFVTSHGSYLEFVGGHTNKAAAQLIQERLSQIDPNKIPDLQTVGKILGAHVGTQEGVGILSQGTLVPQSGGGQGTVVRIGVMAAKRNGLSVVVFAIFQHQPSADQERGLVQELDYALTEFRWPGQ
jgi:hypothetical protein